MGRESISRNALSGVPYGLPRAADDDRQKENVMEKKEGCFFGLFRPECYSRLDNLKKQIVSLKYDLEIERQSLRFAEDEAVKLHEMNEKLKEENEALKKEQSFAWDRAENEYNENIKAADLMIRYDELLQKLNELNEKMKGWLKS